MPSAHRIITSGTALVLCPKIKKHFGVSAALVLQQLHYWLSKENRSYGVIDENGYQWIRNTYEQWCEQIQVITLSTLRRAFSTLEEKNIILSQRFTEKSRYTGGNQGKFYTINYDQLETIMGDLGRTSINRPSHFATQNHRKGNISHKTIVENLHNDITFSKQPCIKSQIETCAKQPTHLFKMNTLPAQNEHPLYITKTTSENTSKKTSFSSIPQHPQHQAVEGKAHQPDTPAEREKINVAEEMLSLWNEIIEQTPNTIALTTKRAQHLNAAFKQFFNSELCAFELFCCKIASSKFLMGDVKAFKANIDWSIRFETIQRILEGGYSFGDRVVAYKPKHRHVDAQPMDASRAISPDTETQHPDSNGMQESPEATMLRQRIKQIVGDAIYQSWFKNTEIVCEDNDTQQKRPTIYVSSRFIAERLRTHYRDLVEAYFYDIRVGKPDILHSVAAETCAGVKNVKAPIELISVVDTLDKEVEIQTDNKKTTDLAQTDTEAENTNTLDIVSDCQRERADVALSDVTTGRREDALEMLGLSDESTLRPLPENGSNDVLLDYAGVSVVRCQNSHDIIDESRVTFCIKNTLSNRQKGRGVIKVSATCAKRQLRTSLSAPLRERLDDGGVREYEGKANIGIPIPDTPTKMFALPIAYEHTQLLLRRSTGERTGIREKPIIAHTRAFSSLRKSTCTRKEDGITTRTGSLFSFGVGTLTHIELEKKTRANANSAALAMTEQIGRRAC